MVTKGCGFTGHYFTDNRSLAENRKEHSFRFSGNTFTFITDAGVFSKKDVDEGTGFLLEASVPELQSQSLLDLGCGYGVIGIVIKKIFPSCAVMMSDINPRAIELAKLNCEKNEVDCHCIESDGFEAIDQTFDTIMLNPPIRAGKNIIYRLFDEAYAHLDDGGSLYVVIRRKQGAESALSHLEETFKNCSVLAKKKGYWVLKSTKLTD